MTLLPPPREMLLFLTAAVVLLVTPGPAVWTMGLLSDSLWALTAGSAAEWLKQNRIFLRHQKNVSGTVYIGLGLATAVGGSGHK